MKALLLAAGLGTRLQPITADIPKCLVPINGKPLLGIWLSLLNRGGVSRILINTHHFANRVVEFVRADPHVAGTTVVYEEALLGTAGTAWKNRDFFGREPFMLIHADNLSCFEVKDFLAAHAARPQGCEMTMMLFRSTTPQSCGIVQVDSRGVVQKFFEKVPNPPGNLANGAVYILEPTILPFLGSLKKEFIDFSTEVLPHFLGRISTFLNTTYHRDIGTPESYQIAQTDFPWALMK